MLLVTWQGINRSAGRQGPGAALHRRLVPLSHASSSRVTLNTTGTDSDLHQTGGFHMDMGFSLAGPRPRALNDMYTFNFRSFLVAILGPVGQMLSGKLMSGSGYLPDHKLSDNCALETETFDIELETALAVPDTIEHSQFELDVPSGRVRRAPVLSPLRSDTERLVV